MKIHVNTSEASKNKVFGLLYRVWLRLVEFYHQERLKFILGFTSERFAFASFYVNGIRHPLQAGNWSEFERLVNHHCERLHMKKVSSFMLAKMWASRRLIKFQTESGKLEVVTYWHF